MTNPDLDRDLGAWLKERAPARAPETLLGATLHRTARTRPRAAWRIPDRWLPKGVSVGARRWGAAAIVIVLLILMLIAVALFPFVGGPQVRPTPKLGVDIPLGAEEGTIETPLGPARWVHLVGDQDTLPPASIEAGDGATFTAEETSRDELGRETMRRHWSSTDGMRWTSTPAVLPFDAGAARPFEGGGASWHMTWQPSGLWRSAGGDDWHEIDLTGVVPPGPAALTWEIEPNGLASSGDVTLVHVILRPVEPFQTLGWPEQPGRVSEIEPGVIGILPRGGIEEPPRRLQFEETADGMRAFEDADGTLVADLPGVTYDDVRDWAQRLPRTRDVLAIVEGDRIQPVFHLSYLGDPVGSSLGTIRGTDDGFVALILEATHGPAHLWTSVNGREWTDLGPWDLPVGGPGDAYYLAQVDGEFHAEFHPGSTGMAERIWRSKDGVTWREHIADMPPISYPVELESGMFSWEWLDDGGKAWWGSANGKAWETFDLASLGPRIAEGDPSLGGTGDTAFIVVDDESGRRDMWILSFDSVPARPRSPGATDPA